MVNQTSLEIRGLNGCLGLGPVSDFVHHLLKLSFIPSYKIGICHYCTSEPGEVHDGEITLGDKDDSKIATNANGSYGIGPYDF